MKKFSLLLVLFFVSLNLRSQDLIRSSEMYPELRYYSLRGEVFFTAYRQVKGTSYFSDDWISGNINLKEGKEIRNVKIKFDVYAHRILVYHESLKRIVIIEKEQVLDFVIMDGKSERIFKKMLDINSKSKVYNGCFLEILSEGSISLYKLYYKDVMPLKNPDQKFIEEFLDETDYFVGFNNQYKQARLSRAYFLHNFPEYKIAIRKFIRKKNLKVRKEKDFVIAIEYVSELTGLLESH